MKKLKIGQTYFIPRSKDVPYEYIFKVIDVQSRYYTIQELSLESSQTITKVYKGSFSHEFCQILSDKAKLELL